jgi:hypothetical protein
MDPISGVHHIPGAPSQHFPAAGQGNHRNDLKYTISLQIEEVEIYIHFVTNQATILAIEHCSKAMAPVESKEMQL